MKVTNTERWLLFSENGFASYYLWQENGKVRVITEDEIHPFILEFESIDEAINHFNKIGKILADYYDAE